MNKKCIYLILLCISISTCNIYTSKAQDVPSERYSLKRAIAITKNTYNKIIKEKAITDLTEYANEGNPYAMHALGMAYNKGLGVKQNLNLSKEWFEKASSKGYKKADYNLAMIYKRGIGVEQDFYKAYQYIQNIAKNEYNQAIYAKGYFLYKGLGCEQNYDEAFKCFKDAASREYAAAMYMLGLCYKNGYGTERDLSESTFWLTKAAKKNIKYSDKKYSIEEPENPIHPIKLKSSFKENIASSSDSRVQYLTENYPDDLNGEYTGNVIFYDWSKTYTTKENQINVLLSQSGNNILMKFKKGDVIIQELKGIISDSILIINQISYSNSKIAPKWDTARMKLKTITEGAENYLTGNIELYSSYLKEPGKPCSINLKKNKNTTNVNVQIEESPTIYPNPFTKSLNISFSLQDQESCAISIQTTAGISVYEKSLGILSTGKHSYQIDLDIPNGNYIAKLTYGDNTYTTIIQKCN